MSKYEAPGVYVEEVSTGARPISAVGTSTAVFFGVTPRSTYPRDPQLVTNWSAYRQKFVDEPPVQAGDEASDGGSGKKTKKTSDGSSDEQAIDPPAVDVLSAAVAGFFANGGSLLYIVNLGPDSGSIREEDMALIAGIDGISLVAAPGYTDADSIGAILSDCEKRRDRFAVLDAQDTNDITDYLKPQAEGGLRPGTTDRGVAAVYVPWIEIADPLVKRRIMVPPSGHLCGAYAMTDGTRGVHKAPANLALRGALGVSQRISQDQQKLLNPKGVNCIRSFDSGIRVWGARTLAPSTSEYRYVPVRRLVTMISQSIQQGTEWVVFEPNDLTLWKSLRRDIGSFLHRLWSDGALAGAQPRDAYFVKCDEETTTQANIDEGEVVALIGIAPVKPAEFVIIRIGQSAGGSSSEGG